jgi:lipoate-protein ligase A
VEGITCRLLPYVAADGPHNMAADEALLNSALDGTASLRFYGWSPPTLSLGYFQPQSVRYNDPLVAGLPFVRRLTGGDTLVHHHELTYALALPAGPPWQLRGVSWLDRMHGSIVAALRNLGVPATSCESLANRPFHGPLCFHHVTAGDVLVGDAKIVGSAQRKRRGALLQHGAILLAGSPHTPTLPGIRELTGRDLGVEDAMHAVVRAFVIETGWLLTPCEWQVCERVMTEELAAAKYSQDSWNRKR